MPKPLKRVMLVIAQVPLCVFAVVVSHAQEASVHDVLSASDPDLEALMDRYVDGENLILGIVDGQAITVESIKSELGTGLDAAVNTQREERKRRFPGSPNPARAKDELAIIYYRARSKAIEMILTREARVASIEISDAVLDVRLEALQREQNIDPKDLAAWARFTLQNFNKTPLELREEFRERMMRERIRAIMAGFFGPIPNHQLPAFFPLEVTPLEMRERYQASRDQWKRLSNVRYSRLEVHFLSTTTVDERKNIFAIVDEARRRISAEESFESVNSYVEQTLKEEAPGADARVVLEIDVEAESDADLRGSLATRIRTMKKGDLSGVESDRQQSENPNELPREVYYVVRLLEKVEDVTREFEDIVVQKQLEDSIRVEKLDLNYRRVEEALIDTAVIIPKSLRLR